MELKEHIEYTKKFIKTYFSFSDKQKAQREAACLSLQFSHCVLAPERNDRFIGKYKRPCVGFAMQDCGMGYFIDEETFNEILRECSEEDAIELTALHDSFSAETGMAQLIAKTPAHILREIPTNDFENRTNIGFWLCRMSGTHFDFDKLLTLGIPGLKTEVLSYKEKCTDSEAKGFYDGLLAMLDAFCTVAEKNAEYPCSTKNFWCFV